MSLRTRRDAALTVTKACPAAGANHNSGTIDLGAAGDAVLEHIEIAIEIPALAALAEAKTLTVKLQDSADDSTYADIEELSSVVVTGGTGGGAAAVTSTVRLPSSTKRYVQANLAVAASGGDNTAVSVTIAPLF